MKVEAGGDGHGYGPPETPTDSGPEVRSTVVQSGTPPRLFSQKKACEYLGGLSIDVLKGLRHRGELASVRIGRRIYLKKEDLDALVERWSYIEE